MCRFLVYQGQAIRLEQLITQPSNSLIAQSLHAKKRLQPVNGDGFGIGWYPTHHDPEPGTFVSIDPAWNNRNLLQLAKKVYSQHFFAHVRDASSGMPVSQANCHPFQYKNFLWMHNGHLGYFASMRRSLINQLSDQAFDVVKGNTDSEHAFAVFLDAIQFDDRASSEQMTRAMTRTIQTILALREKHQIKSDALMNFAVSNGETTIVTRFSTHGSEPASLFYATGELGFGHDDFRIQTSDQKAATLVCSEPLTECGEDWIEVPANHLVILDKYASLTLKNIAI